MATRAASDLAETTEHCRRECNFRTIPRTSNLRKSLAPWCTEWPFCQPPMLRAFDHVGLEEPFLSLARMFEP